MFSVRLICGCFLLLINEPIAEWKDFPSSWLTDTAHFSATKETHCDWFVLQTRDPDLESGDDLEETDREYCQVLLPSIAFVVNYLHTLLSTFVECDKVAYVFTRVNKNPSAWNFPSPKPEVTCGTVAIIIRVVLLSPYLRIRAVPLSSIHYNQSHRVYINRRRQYICLIWN